MVVHYSDEALVQLPLRCGIKATGFSVACMCVVRPSLFAEQITVPAMGGKFCYHTIPPIPRQIVPCLQELVETIHCIRLGKGGLLAPLVAAALEMLHSSSVEQYKVVLSGVS